MIKFLHRPQTNEEESRRKAVVEIYSKFEQDIKAIAEKEDISYRKAKRIVTQLINQLVDKTKNGETVTIPKLGTFTYQQGMLFTNNS